MDAGIIRSSLESVSKGYGDINIHGIDHDGNNHVARASKDAAMIDIIPDSEKYDIKTFIGYAKKLVLRAIAN